MRHWNLRTIVCVSLLLLTAPFARAAKPDPGPLTGHVLPALAKATPVAPIQSSGRAVLTLTLVLKRDDQAGFERYLRDVYDPSRRLPKISHSRVNCLIALVHRVRRMMRYLEYLQNNGFTLVEGSANRLTLTVRGGLRAQIRYSVRAPHAQLRIGNKSFHANNSARLCQVHCVIGPRSDRPGKFGATPW